MTTFSQLESWRVIMIRVMNRFDFSASTLSGVNHDMPMFSVFCHLSCHLVSYHILFHQVSPTQLLVCLDFRFPSNDLSYLSCSFSFIPPLHIPNHLNLSSVNFLSSFFLTAQHSAPYGRFYSCLIHFLFQLCWYIPVAQLSSCLLAYLASSLRYTSKLKPASRLVEAELYLHDRRL